jgi:alpha-muurolene/germacrene-A/gamma-muurolene synthase
MQARFKESLHMFFDAVNTQARARDKGIILDIESYVEH